MICRNINESIDTMGIKIIGNENIIFKGKTSINFLRFSIKFVFNWTIWTQCNISKPMHALKHTWVRTPHRARSTTLSDKVFQ